ncbi:MAG TPA: biopolymer transporter ExbD [Gammaproteobacteria bacterium]|nr:biopolymer transporter ExbD [Gammaproteobacteria bacterium]
MKLQSRSREEPEQLNLTSLIDVVLMLLIFFMLSSSFVHENSIRLRLPQAKSDAPAAASDALEITVTKVGAYLVNGHPLVNNERRTLRLGIEKLIGNRRDMPVSIKADALATHQAVVTAMDVIGQLGFVNVNIATVAPP